MKILIWFVIFFSIINIVSAQLSVEKLVEKDEITVDSNLKVLLKVKNEFAKAVPIQIQSKDVIGSNGYDVECYEFTLGPEPEATLQLSEIQALTPGNFTLEKATITYYDPNTGQQAIIESNEYNVTVTGKVAQDIYTESITTIYQCNGQSMQSTQTKTVSSQQQQNEQNEQEQQQQSQQQQQEQSQQQKDEMQKKMDQVQNNQMNQDASALKKEMQKELQEQQQMQNKFEKQLQNNSDLQKMQEELKENGFEQTDKQMNPENNNTGDFEYEYKDKQGETAKISGEMQDGEMQELSKESSIDSKKFENLMQNNSMVQQMEQELENLGFNKTDFNYQSNGNMTQAQMSYENKLGEKANISAEFKNETITKVDLHKPKDEKKRAVLWFIIICLLLAGLSYWYYLKKMKKMAIAVEEKRIAGRPFDYATESMRLLDKALKLFNQKRYKDAYGKASESLRLFYSHKLELKKEITATDTIKLLKKKRIPFSNAQKCLSLCGLVEFAKYEPNSKDFNEIIRLVKKEIK